MLTITVTLSKYMTIDSDGDCDLVEVEEVLPAEYVVCWDCSGEGRTLSESLRGAFTQSEFDECFDDDDSREQYFRGGRGIYGAVCKTCCGQRVTLEIARAKLTPEQVRFVEELDEQEEERAREDRADAYTRRMESGGY
jgi:hypothetical protein